MAGLVHSENGIEAIALDIGGMVQEPHFCVLAAKAVQMPFQPFENVVR